MNQTRNLITWHIEIPNRKTNSKNGIIMHLVKFLVNGQMLTWQSQHDDMAKSTDAGQRATGTVAVMPRP